MKHVTDVTSTYSDNAGASSVLFVNLVDNKKDQGKLGAEFKEVVDGVRPRIAHPLLFYWFDFHHECKQKGKWQNLSKLVSMVDDRFRAQRYFSRSAAGVVTMWQTGVIRTNCMDNLDRTNVVQSLFARRSLIMQLGHLSLLDNPAHVLNSPWKEFEKAYKGIWANNADAISVGYAGTGALKVDFTKTGKRTVKGMINDGVNSCIRYYVNNFTDGVKQDAIDLMLGNYRPDAASASPFVPRPGQETLANNVTKAFVMLMIIFSSLLLLLPPSITAPAGTMSSLPASSATAAGNPHISGLCFNLVVALAISAVVVLYIMYVVVKKGSKIGQKIVVHPQLLPEPLPN